MSRHRNVRTMNYDDGMSPWFLSFKADVTGFYCNLFFCVIITDYEGYDDVYGHSMEDDYGVSPSGKMIYA